MVDNSSPTGTHPTPNVSLQLRFFQVLSVILLVLLLGGAGYYVYKQRQIQPVALMVAGRAVATVSSEADAKAIIKNALLTTLGSAYGSNGQPRFQTPILLQRVSDNQSLDTDDSALAKLIAADKISTLADVILIDKKPAVALPSKEMAQSALDDVRQHYADMPPKAPPVEKPTFVEQVTIDRRRVSTALCKDSAEDAGQLLITPPQAKTTVVQAHQTGWSIARKFHLSFTEFIRANSGRDLDHLTPGDTVNISRTYPLLTVIVRKESSSTQAILPGTSAENAGERRITVVTTYMNGVQTGASEPVSVFTVRRAKPWSSIE